VTNGQTDGQTDDVGRIEWSSAIARCNVVKHALIKSFLYALYASSNQHDIQHKIWRYIMQMKLHYESVVHYTHCSRALIWIRAKRLAGEYLPAMNSYLFVIKKITKYIVAGKTSHPGIL